MSRKGTVEEKSWTTKVGLQALCLFVHGSHRCGYVKVPTGHPLHDKDYNEVNYMDVHGGLTFSGAPTGETGWWLGFDCAHAGDKTAYFNGTERTLEYVVDECESLAKQIQEAQCPEKV